MSKRGWWITAFLTVTGVAIGGELLAAFDGNPETVPWTGLLVQYVPEPVTIGLASILVAWLIPHFTSNYADRKAAMNPSPTPVPPTQTRHPWRAVARTLFAALVGGLTLLPEVVTAAHVGTVPTVAQVLVVTGTVTRVLAMPGVNAWLGTYLPWLSASPSTPLSQ